MNSERFEKYYATLLGCAIGDALGMPVEGWKKNQIKKHAGRITAMIDPVLVKNDDGSLKTEDEFGKLKYYTKDLKAGNWTDDTILTMAVAESIAEKQRVDIEDIAKKHILAFEKYGNRGFGGTTQLAFDKLKAGISPYESGVIGGPGNAPAMKMSPVGIYMDAKFDSAKGLYFASEIARITHLDPRSVVSGIMQANAIYMLLKNSSREDFIQGLMFCTTYERKVTPEFSRYDKGSLTEKIQWIKENKDVNAEDAHSYLRSSSLVVESYPFALFMFQKYFDNPLEGLIEIVNYGGDCDTTGAIYGCLAGARFGNIFPKEWEEKIENLDAIKDVAAKLANLKK